MFEKRMKPARMTQSLRWNVSQGPTHIFSGMSSKWPEILLFWNHKFITGSWSLELMLLNHWAYRRSSERPVTCGELVTGQGLEPGLLTPSQSSFKYVKWPSFQVSSAPESWTEAWLLPWSSHRQLESLLPWILPAGSLVCFLILNRLDTLSQTSEGLGRTVFCKWKYKSQSSRKQVHAACPFSVEKGERSQRPGLYLQEEPS